MTIRWITPMLGTAPADGVSAGSNLKIIDVRELVDKAGNNVNIIKDKINEGVRRLRVGERIVVCCDYGISRSNAVAAGIISIYQGITLDAAIRFVQTVTGEFEIKLAPLNAVRKAIGESTQQTSHKEHRTILITGSSGFIGGAICQKLREKFSILAPTRGQLDLERGSTQLGVLVREANIDCIVHLANPRVFTSNIALGTTLTMLRNVLEVCVSENIPLIYPSSWEVYSGYNGTLSVNEVTPVNPMGPYGETKYLSEKLINHFRSTTRLRCGILRSSTIYGDGGDRPKFLKRFSELAAKSQTITTHMYNNGEPALDMVHIDDFVDAIKAAIERNFFETLNIGTGVLTSTRLIATIIANSLGTNPEFKFLAINANFASISMDFRMANEILGWNPKIDILTGLSRFVTGLNLKKELCND